jgi:Cof subfamily protein (haloacid dehalogenase superfamily)
MKNIGRKYVFLDIDGTLIDKNETLHKSTALAVKKAAANGHKLFISTGRAKLIVCPKLFEIGLNNGVFSAGASVICENKEIFHSSFSPEVYDKMVDVLIKHDSVITVECFSRTLFAESTMRSGFESFRRWIAELGAIFVEDVPKGLTDVDKVVFFPRTTPMEQISEELGRACNIVTMSYQGGEIGGEIMQEGITKATGIQKVLDYYGASIADTIAVGDGANDVEMLKFCHTGIAMGNSDPRAKEAANYVTDDIARDGLYKAFVKAGLI